MLLPILSKLTSESLLSLYPIFVKKIGISSALQLWTRLITYVVVAAFFVDWSFIWSTIGSMDSITLALVNLSHIYFSYEGFRHLDSGVSFAIFNSYPLMILILGGVMWHKSYVLVLLGLALFIYGNYTEKKEDKTLNKDKKEKEEDKGSVDFYYGLGMILLAALTEAFIYFLVRRVKTLNHWNHVFISYFFGAVIMSLYIMKEIQIMNDVRVGIAVLVNGIIGSVGYFLRFFASYRLEPSVYAPLSYFGVVMSYVYGMLFDNETLNWKKVLGTVSILASNYFAPN
jgi:drug/metabolite transporter (DMT)-like permease